MSANITININGAPDEVFEALSRLASGFKPQVSLNFGTEVNIPGNGKDHTPETTSEQHDREAAAKPKNKKGQFVKGGKKAEPEAPEPETERPEAQKLPEETGDVYVTAIRSLQDAYGTPKGTEAVAKLREIFNVKKFAEIAKDKHQEFYAKVQELLA